LFGAVVVNEIKGDQRSVRIENIVNASTIERIHYDAIAVSVVRAAGAATLGQHIVV
jgi:hypothetical protein